MDSARQVGEWTEAEADARRLDQFAEDEDEDFLANASSAANYSPQPPPPEPEPVSVSSALSPTPLTEAEAVELGKSAIRAFLRSRSVYEAMPKSGRVVVFDVNINLKLVLYALLEHEIRGAPLWNPSTQRLMGMTTLSDFADIIRYCVQTGEDIGTIFETHTIFSWRALLPRALTASADEVGRKTAAAIYAEHQNKHPNRNELIFVPPNTTLFEACETLKRERVHRLPVIDPVIQTCLQVITFQSILEYLTAQFTEDRRLFDQSIYGLGIGTYREPQTSKFMKQEEKPTKNLFTATLNTSLSQVAEMFSSHDISTIPILDPTSNKVRDLYHRSFLASHNLEQENPFAMNMDTVLQQYEAAFPDMVEQVHTCTPNSTLYQVFVRLAETKVRTLTVVDDDGAFLGLVFVIRRPGSFPGLMKEVSLF